MAVLLMDSYDFNDTLPSTIGDRYAVSTPGDSFSSTTPRGTGYSLFGNQALHYDFGSNLTGKTYIVGSFLRLTAVSNTAFYGIRNSTPSTQVYLRLNNIYQLERGANLERYEVYLYPNIWYHLEWKVKITNSTATGEWVIKLDGSEVVNQTGIDTQAQSTDEVRYIYTMGSDDSWYWDDFYVLDTTGTWANDFIGPSARMEALRPNGNGNYNQFDGSDGNSTDNYLLVDETDFDGDTSYVESAAVGDRDSYTFGNISGTVDSVLAVQIMSKAEKHTGTNTRNLNHFIRQSSTDYDNSTSHALTTDAYRYKWDIYDSSPDTSTQWNSTKVDALEAGVRVQ